MEVEDGFGIFRCPDAELVETPKGLAVRLVGEPEFVALQGVRTYQEGADLVEVVELEESAHDAYLDLVSVAAAEDEEAAGQALLDHVHRFGCPALCSHGRLPWHPAVFGDVPDLQPSGGVVLVAGTPCLASESGLLDVAAIAQVVRGMDALYAGLELARSSQPPTAEVLGSLATIAPGATPRGIPSDLWTPKDWMVELLESGADLLLRDAGVLPALRWSTGRGPGIVLSARTLLGVYLAEMVLHAGAVRRPVMARCAICGAEVTPRRNRPRGQKSYCRTPECQRERARRNKRRERMRAAKGVSR